MNLWIQSPRALGLALRDARRGKGLTQAQLAELVGVRQPTVSNLERGVQSLSLPLVLRVVAVLDLELTLRTRPADSSAAWESS